MTAPTDPPPGPGADEYADGEIGAYEMRDIESSAGRVSLRRRIGPKVRWTSHPGPPAFRACDNEARYR